MGTSIVLSVIVLALVGASQAKYHQETIQPIQRFSSFGTSQTSPFTNTRQSNLGTRGFSKLNTVNGDVSSTGYHQTSPVFAAQNVLRNNVVGVNHNQRFNAHHTNNNIHGVNHNQRFHTLRTNNNNIHGANHNQRYNVLRTNNNIHSSNHNQRFNTLRTNNNNIHGVHHNQRFHSLRNNNQRVNFRSTNSLNGQFVSGNQYLGSAAGLEDPNLLSHRSESDGLGSYNFAYQTADGVTRQEEGTPIGLDPLAVRGSYSYTSPEGVEVVVNYVADENGFQVQSPNVPAIPEHSRLQILRAEEARQLGIDISNAGNEGTYSNLQTLNRGDIEQSRLNHINDHQSGLGLIRNFNTVGTLRSGVIGNNHLGSTTRVVDHYQITGVDGHHNGVRSGSTFARKILH